MSRVDGFIVLTAAARLKSKKHRVPIDGPMTTTFYLKLGSAKNAARSLGDSVVALSVDLGVAPVFIRGTDT